MELFPITIATGRAFCNRHTEREQLAQYIHHGIHSVLIAPRRYGKSSLINQVLLEQKTTHNIMELTMAATPEDVAQLIIRKVGELLQKILPKTMKAKQNILKLFQFLNPEIILTAGGQKIKFHPTFNKSSVSNNISGTLLKLDQAAVKANKRVVLVMDEFQALSEFEEHTIEASIRNAMQYSKKVVYIFSGSNRHMLYGMFNDKNRPFYNSCEMIYLDRILAEDYKKFIQKESLKKWGKVFTEEILRRIFELSELHPSYVNRLCSQLWLTNLYPTLDSIDSYWNKLILSRRIEFTKDILRLSNNQKKLLQYIAKNPTIHPSSQNVCASTGLSEASSRQALNKLIKMDYIYKDDQGYIKLIDPAFRDYINIL